MVCSATPRLGFQPTQCLARPMLYAALARYDAGDYVGAGVRLRESVKRFLVAACEWYDVPLPKDRHPSPAELARRLHKAKQLDKWGLETILECIEVGNHAAHCQTIDRQSLRGGIALLFALMDGEPYCPLDRTPIVTSYMSEGELDDYDCDDNDPADWWKSEGGA